MVVEGVEKPDSVGQLSRLWLGILNFESPPYPIKRKIVYKVFGFWMWLHI